MSSDKLKIVKNFKLSPEILQLFESALKGLHEQPLETELLPSGEARVSQSDQMSRMIDIGLLSLEMNMAMMKNILASHIEHELNEEILNTKMEDKMNQALKMMGIDPEKKDEFFGR